MNQKITVNGQDYEMPKMDVETYMEYLDISEAIGEKQRYTRKDMEAMAEFLVKAYGRQFTVEALKDGKSGVDAAGMILAFQLIDTAIAGDLTARVEDMKKNFSSGR